MTPGNEQSGRLPIWLLACLIGVVALFPRVVGLNDFYTIDEGYHWPGRVERFSTALATGDWASTDQTGHPGVTTMWLGSLGRAIAFQQGILDPGWAGGGARYLGMLRLPLAIVNAGMLVVAFLLLCRLLPTLEALIAGLLWASSPFLIAHSRLLHLDGLVTSFMALSILFLLIGLRFDNQRMLPLDAPAPASQPMISARRRFIVGSGICAGLALLTKAPSLILLPFVGLLIATTALLHAWLQHPGQADSAPQPITLRLWLVARHAIPLIIAQYLLWMVCAALVVFALWPAMWVNPAAATQSVLIEIFQNGGQPHHSGNYFLGQPVADPGPLFYLAVVLLRTTPLTLIGLVLCVLWLGSAGRNWRAQQDRPAVLPGLALLAFVLLFGILMSSQAKKLDRYLLPAWPAIEILAAVGLSAAGRWLSMRFRSLRRRLFATAAPIAIALLALLSIPQYHPYYLAYYNPLVGGGPVAQRVMLVGIGEGMDQIGAWLRTRPDLQRGDVLTWIPPTLAPFIPIETLARDLRPEFTSQASSYAVLYIRSVQHKESAEAEAQVRQTPALFTLRLHGVEYASIHQLPRPYATAIDGVFADALQLRGFSQQLLGNTLIITPSWNIQRDHTGGIYSFVHVLDASGQKVGQVDAPIDQGMFANWQAGQQFDGPLPITLPANLPAGEYQVLMGVYDPAGGRLPLTSGTAIADSIDGPHVIKLDDLVIR